MAFNSADWSIDYATKTITNSDSGTGNNLPSAVGNYDNVGTVLEFFQWCASTFANSSQMDDEYAFVSDTPNVYRWVNDWIFGNTGEDYKYLKGGSIESADSSLLYSNVYSIGSQETGAQMYMLQNDTEVTPWWISGNIDVLVPVKVDDAWVQSDNVSGTPTNGGIWIYAREFGDNYDHNFASLSGGGSTPIGINTSKDSGNRSGELYLEVTTAEAVNLTADNFLLGGTTGAVGKITSIDTINDYVYLSGVRGGVFTGTETLTEYTDRELQTASGQSTTMVATTNVVSGYSDITTTFGTISRDLNNGAGSVNYDAEIDCAARPMTEVYEWSKYITRYGSVGGTYTLNSDDGQEYRSAIEGTYTDVKVSPFGTLAGTTFYGARGIWVTNYSAAEFVLIDATGTTQSPPNYQRVTATNALLNACQVFVAEITAPAGTIIKDQYTIDIAGNLSITTTANININKTPQTGVLRVADVQYTYTSFDASAFVITADATGETGALYVPLLDVAADATTEQSDNIIYNGVFDVRTVVRKYGYKPYTADTVFGSNGLSFSPILTVDPQAT